MAMSEMVMVMVAGRRLATAAWAQLASGGAARAGAGLGAGPRAPALACTAARGVRALASTAAAGPTGPSSSSSSWDVEPKEPRGEGLPEHLREEAVAAIPRERTRNFSIIAHVDHGKSTLADRLLEEAGNVVLGGKRDRQVLDDLKVERERGITVKARTASMVFDGHLINLVDTPGHVDFDYEVKRALRSCQGALLLVDATQGVQAQTLANYHSARAVGLAIIPVLTKLDLPHSDPAAALEQIEKAFGIDEDQVIWTSAKSGEGCDEILPAIVERVAPPPPPDAPEMLEGAKFRAMVVDSWYDRYKGTICLVYVDHGTLSAGDEFYTDTIAAAGSARPFTVTEVGHLIPQPQPRSSLRAGMVGYLSGGIKQRTQVEVGDHISDDLQVLVGGAKSGERGERALTTPKVFASVYPVDAGDFDDFRRSLERLSMNDSSVVLRAESSTALGPGFRCGFLGKLHMEVFFQRLDDEFGTAVIATAPSVPYFAVMKDGSRVLAETASALPNMSTGKVSHYLEPMVTVTLLTPVQYMGAVMTLFKDRRARQLEMTHLDETRLMIKYCMPWQEVMIDLHDDVKTASSGFASFDYEEAEPEASQIGRVDILLNGKAVDALAFVCHRSVAEKRGRAVALRLKRAIKRQQFEVILQAAIGSKIVARERIPPVRKDVLVKSGKTVGGGDVSRKKKLLEKQKAGKKRLKTVGNVQLDQQAFLSVLGGTKL